MKNLFQERYKDDNGHPIDASKVEVLASCTHIADGFYKWSCGKCNAEHDSRACGWPIAGQVLECKECKTMNLLVRTDCEWVTDKLRLAPMSDWTKDKPWEEGYYWVRSVEEIPGTTTTHIIEVFRIWRKDRPDCFSRDADPLASKLYGRGVMGPMGEVSTLNCWFCGPIPKPAQPKEPK